MSIFYCLYQSSTCTRTENVTWTPTSSYNAAGTKTASGTNTCTITVEANVITRTFVSLNNIYAADKCYINGTLNSEVYIDGYLVIVSDISYTSGEAFNSIPCSVPIKDLSLYGITIQVSGVSGTYGEMGDDGIFRLTKQAISADTTLRLLFINGTEQIGYQNFAISVQSAFATTISYLSMPWEALETVADAYRAKGQTVFVMEQSILYQPIPKYIFVELPYGQTSGTFQIPIITASDPCRYIISNVSNAGAKITPSSTTLVLYSNGTTNPTTLSFA